MLESQRVSSGRFVLANEGGWLSWLVSVFELSQFREKRLGLCQSNHCI